MIRTFIALAAFAVVVNAPAAGPIDLDVPDNLAAVQRDRPEHYAKIQKILAEAPMRAWNAQTFAQWMQVDFDARDVRANDLIMTSLPPKKRLEFSLGETAYSKTLTLPVNATPMLLR